MSAAIAEPTTEVHAEEPMTPVGDVYEQALAKLQGKEEKPAEKVTEAPETKSEPEVKAKDATAPAKPTTALEAALAEPDKKEESAPTEELPEQLPNEGRKEHWQRARQAIATRDTTIKAHEKAIADLRQELGKAKDNPETTAKIQALEAKVAELTDGITAANIELLPEFRAKYIDGEKSLVAKAADKVKAYGGNPDLLREALGMQEGMRRDAAIEEAMGENANDMARSKVNAIVAQLDDLRDQAQSERANAQQAYERLTQKQQAQLVAAATESEQRKVQTFEQVAKRLHSEVPSFRFVDPSADGAEKWNAGIREAIEQAPILFSTDVSPEETVSTAFKGKHYDIIVPALISDLTLAREEIAQLKKQQAELDSAQPDMKGGKAPAKDKISEAMEKTPGQIYAETMAGLQNREDT